MIEESFLRQRRNVVLMASLVIFINATGASLKKISLLGNELELDNPSAMRTILGMALGYLMLRYIQYAHEIEDKGFKERFLRRVEYYLRAYILKREYKKKGSDLPNVYPNINDVAVTSLTMFHDAMEPNTAAVTFEPKKAGAVIDAPDVHVSNMELIFPCARASIYITLRTRLVTDFIFPPVFAALAYATYCPPIRSILASWL